VHLRRLCNSKPPFRRRENLGHSNVYVQPPASDRCGIGDLLPKWTAKTKFAAGFRTVRYARGMLPLNLDQVLPTAWPESLRPIGESTFEKEPFSDWWHRNRQMLAHLPRDLVEQWIYRHWTHSPFSFLPLDDLTWKRRFWSGADLLRSIHRAWGEQLDPQFDYDTFQRQGGADRHPTALALDCGTWDYPMVLLSTPFGIIDGGRSMPSVRLVIVEGHQRHRYLNALHSLGKAPAGPHETIILSTPLTGSEQTVSPTCG